MISRPRQGQGQKKELQLEQGVEASGGHGGVAAGLPLRFRQPGKPFYRPFILSTLPDSLYRRGLVVQGG